jgi:hypothetical protein
MYEFICATVPPHISSDVEIGIEQTYKPAPDLDELVYMIYHHIRVETFSTDVGKFSS